MNQADAGLPQISVNERDRRYALIRQELRNANVDCAIATGTNLFYVTNGILGEMFGLLPATDDPPTVVINFRQLADISVDVLLDMQEWIRDIRGGVDGSQIIARINELKLEKATLGLAGYANINQAFYGQL